MFDPRTALEPALLNQPLDSLFEQISANYAVDERQYLHQLVQLIPDDSASIDAVTQKATQLITAVRQQRGTLDLKVETLLQEYALDTHEGILLMCLAEALLRIPDGATADALIEDRLQTADWAKHINQSDSLLVNASTWGLLLTGKLIELDHAVAGEPANAFKRLAARLGESVLRQAMYAAMRLLGQQFVLGQDINDALNQSKQTKSKGYQHSYDMLGEAAVTDQDAQRYFDAYANAIQAIGQQSNPNSQEATISIKLSALHPRYEATNEEEVLDQLTSTVKQLIEKAKDSGVGVTIDAEESDRLELSLKLFQKLFFDQSLKEWANLGMVVQAYSKRALPTLIWLTALAKAQSRQIPIRLVKGAYWDSEIKWTQQKGLADYPVFTRKVATDLSYLACAKYLLSESVQPWLFPQFATHNAQTIAAIEHMVTTQQYELQRLHGMGEALYDVLIAQGPNQKLRIYAPVGAHKELLPYLVRRLLENGANTSFVHKLMDPNTPVDSLAIHPLSKYQAQSEENRQIPKPIELFGTERRNSLGLNLNIDSERSPLLQQLKRFENPQWQANPIVNGRSRQSGRPIPVFSPQNRKQQIGITYHANQQDIEDSLESATAAFISWNQTPTGDRAAILRQWADLLEQHRAELIALCTQEAGKTIQDGIDEVREAVDFLRYYAAQATVMMAVPETLPGPTGEHNQLMLEGRGVFVCISPWNFPLAIFLGQVSAALATGNTVIAKPAETTSLIAFRACYLGFEAGLPKQALQLLTGTGLEVGNRLVANNDIAGVCFTGSTATARRINQQLAQRDGPIVPLIAETGGQNAMLVDSTALPEQVIKDVLASAFQSAGQRCSALRVLYVQSDVADELIRLLKGAMARIKVGNPALVDTDVGPVISDAAKTELLDHIRKIKKTGQFIAQAPLPEECDKGDHVPPTAIEINHISELTKEHFGPILHLIRFQRDELSQIITDINDTGFGLTLGIHSRNESWALEIARQARVGNIYINRNQIGATVGVQPFGGMGLSGTGPKAGGPHYLNRFVTEKTLCHNITAIGGNTKLLSQDSI